MGLMNEQILRDHALVVSQSACALISAIGMFVANSQHPNDQPYSIDDIKAVIDAHGIGYNSVMTQLYNR
jgi:hypothetical protein